VWRQLKDRIDALWSKLLHEHASPARLAAAVFVGCVVGTSPFLGLHFPICLLFAFLLRLNKIVVYAAANISIAPLAPLLAFGSAQIGSRLTAGHWLLFTADDFRSRPLRELAQDFFYTWLVGGVALGAAIGVVGAAAVYVALNRRRVVSTFDAALTRATERYRGLHPRLYWYARMKYRMDPVYRAVSEHVPPGTLTIDLGAGLGMLSVVLDELGDGRRSIGVEWDEAKVRAAEHAKAAVQRGDITRLDTSALPMADVVTIIDVLHYFDDATIARVLDSAVSVLAPGGSLLIREGDAQKSGGSRWTRFVEAIAVRVGWNRAHAVQFRPADFLRQALEQRGLCVSVHDTAGKLHPGNVLFVARRDQRSIATPSTSIAAK
jgi:uncharacterized protein (DUF2062 family)/SAM-dependent methyltransferase